MEAAISLANTLSEGSDLLRTPADMAEWLESESRVLGQAPPEVALRVSEFRMLRDAVRGLLEAVVSRRTLQAEAVAFVNRASASLPAHIELDLADPAQPRVVDVLPAVNPAARVLAQIARSAIRLLGSDAADVLRVCAAPRCGRFFKAARPDRVWCSLACGNRARVARHAARSQGRERWPRP
ncbi:MAG: ABATE domain-containing protein [Actinomycetota bacterium]